MAIRFIVRDSDGAVLKKGRYSANHNPGVGNTLATWKDGVSPAIPTGNIKLYSATLNVSDEVTIFTKDINVPYLKLTLTKTDDTALPDNDGDGIPEIMTTGDPSAFKVKVEKMDGLTDLPMTGAGDNETLAVVVEGMGNISDTAPALVNGVVTVTMSDAVITGQINVRVKDPAGNLAPGFAKVQVKTGSSGSADDQTVKDTTLRSTTSAAYVDLPNSTIVADQGTGRYEISFNGAYDCSNNADVACILSINAADEVCTENVITASANDKGNFSLSLREQVNDGETIKIRFKTSAGTLNVNNFMISTKRI